MTKNEKWHYTSLEGCLGIIESQSIWLTDILATNDSKDGRFAKDLMIEYYAPILLQNMDPIEKSFNNTDNIRQETERRFQILFDCWVSKKSKFSNFIFCLSDPCPKNLDDGRLSMWRGYGSGSPVAIVFNQSMLKKLLKNFIDSRSLRLAYFFDKVCYVKSLTDFPKATFNKELRALDCMVSKGVDWDWTRDVSKPDKVGQVLDAVSELSFSIKHKGFFEERESRIALTSLSAESEHPIKEYQGKKRYVVDLGESLFQCIEKIVTGPNSENSYLELRSHPLILKYKIPLYTSFIPYRHSAINHNA